MLCSLKKKKNNNNKEKRKLIKCIKICFNFRFPNDRKIVNKFNSNDEHNKIQICCSL
jgi:hypothetical protein